MYSIKPDWFSFSMCCIKNISSLVRRDIIGKFHNFEFYVWNIASEDNEPILTNKI